MPAVPILFMTVATELPQRKRATRSHAPASVRGDDLERFMARLCPQAQPDDTDLERPNLHKKEKSRITAQDETRLQLRNHDDVCGASRLQRLLCPVVAYS